MPIVFSGLRPGEKLYEELLGAEEGSEPTKHDKIFRARTRAVSSARETLIKIDKLIKASNDGGDREHITEALMELVPTYKPSVPLHLPRQEV